MDNNEIIACMKYKNSFCWFICNKFAGKVLLEGLNDLKTIDFIQLSTISTEALKNQLKEAVSENIENYIDYLPAFFVDMDLKKVFSFYSEMDYEFEVYAPSNFESLYEDFLDKIPVRERYWIINKKNYFI